MDGETGTVGSSQFKIKSGISPLLIAGGGLVVGGIVAVILLLDNPGSSSDLPIAPEPN